MVALTLDESGIPATADGRLAVAEKIYRKAAEYGIQKKDIIIDPLCMTISSDSQGALTTLEAVHRVKEDLGGKTILGVSNISFGLPQREIINSSFFYAGADERPERGDYQSEFRGYDAIPAQLPGAGCA